MTSQSVRPFTSVLTPRQEVLEGEVVEAVNLADIYVHNELRGRLSELPPLKPNPLYDPSEFLRRTYFSEPMKQVLIKVFGALAGVSSVYLDEKGSSVPVTARVYIIPSHIGGGKTHLLATIYHFAKLFNKGGLPEVLKQVEDREVKLKHALRHALRVIQERYGRIQVVAIVGDTRTLAPSPDSPLEIDGVKTHTPWGLLAYLLGSYKEVETSDVNFYAPRVDELRKILHGKSVLILFDEAAEYMELAVRLDSRHKGYKESYLSFIRNLAQAVSETPGAVLVITLPAEYSQGKLVPGIQKPEYVEEINGMLTRVGHEYIPPLEFRKDVVEVFKKRLFEDADSQKAREASDLIARVVKDKANRDETFAASVASRYGDLPSLTTKIGNYYPFHPALIDILVQIAASNPELGLTRYLLAYVGRVLKHIYDKKQRIGRDPPISLITTWAIPLERIEFRTELLRGMFSQLQSELLRIYEQDVKRHVDHLGRLLWGGELDRQHYPDMVKAALAATVWVYTIPGRGSRGREALKIYPMVRELPAMVYDPLAMEGVLAADVLNALSELLNSSTYMTELENRVFYALVPDIQKFLRDRYLSSTDNDALVALEQTFASPDSFRPGRKIKKVIPIVIDKFKEIEDQLKSELASSQGPMLFVYLALSEPPNDLDSTILLRNNIVLLKPNYSLNPRELGLTLTENFKGIIGSEPPTLREFLKSLLKLYRVITQALSNKDLLRSEFGEENYRLVEDSLKRMKGDAEKLIVLGIYSALTTAVLGKQRLVYTINLRPVEEEVKDLSNLAKLVEETLEKRGVLTTWTWLDVYNQLSDWKEIWSEVDRSIKKPISVASLWDQLLTSEKVKPHLTSFNDFKEALKSAYETNEIAFKSGETIVWLKHPYTPEEATQYYQARYSRDERLNDWDRDVEGFLQLRRVSLANLEVVSPRLIIERYIDSLLQQEQVRPGERVVRRLVVYLPDGRKEDFKVFLAGLKSDLEKAEGLSRYPVVLVEETPKRVFYLKGIKINDAVYTGTPLEIEADRKASLRIRGSVDAEEVFAVRVKVRVVDELGRDIVVEDVEVKTPSAFTLDVVVERAGVFTMILEAQEAGGYHVAEPIARVRVRGELCLEKTLKGVEFAEVLRDLSKAPRITLKTIILRGVVRNYAIPYLRDVLEELGRLQAKAKGILVFKIAGEELKLEFTNASPSRLAKFVASVGVEGELEANIAFTGLTLQAIANSRVARPKLFEEDLAPLVTVELEECRKV